MRQLLRRLAVSALLAPVAAIGATTMIANPAQAAPAKPSPAQPALSQPGLTQPGLPQFGNWKPDPSQPGTWQVGTWKPGSWNHGSWKPRSTWPRPTMPSPTQPAPVQPTKPAPTAPAPTAPAPTKPVPTAPVPSAPVPTKPAPTRPAPTKPVPTTPAPSTSNPATSADQALQDEINRLINVQRTTNGCAALTVNEQLTTAARNHSIWMAQTGTMSHTGNAGSTFVTRSKAAGYARPSAENVAMGQRTATEVVNAWMNSSGHRANILNCQSTTVGVGVARAGNGTPYYTQNFGY